MRILLFDAEYAMTGAALMLCRYGVHLAQAGHEVVVVPRAGETGPLEAVYRDAGIMPVADGRLEIGSETLAICNTLMAGPDVLRLAPYCPTVWWLHEGEIGLEVMARSPGLVAAFEQASVIVLPTPILRDRIYRSFLLRVPEERQVVIPYGVDAPPPRPPRVPGPVRAVFIGSLYPRKRPVDVLRALDNLPRPVLDVHFVGHNHGTMPEFETRVATCGDRVRLYGELPYADAMAVLDQADIFLLPSGSECLPLSPIDAGVRGIPSVLSDLPAHEGVWRHGRNCLMHPVGDFELLAHMMRVMAVDPALRARLGAAAKVTARRFRSDLMMTRMDLALASVA